jgi:hypothetical protein
MRSRVNTHRYRNNCFGQRGGDGARRGRRQAGFSIIELLLATSVFGALATGLVGALVYGQQSIAASGDRVTANYLAEGGIEATRNIANNSFANLTDGTHGLQQTGGVWTFNGTSETVGEYTRQIIVSSTGTKRKDITVQVSWPQFNSTSTVTLSTRITNWAAGLPHWTAPMQSGTADTTGTTDGKKVATSGNYAYVVKNASTNNFIAVDISNPETPVVVSTTTLPGTTTNIAVDRGYAYVTTTSNTAELIIVDISNSAAPVQVGTYNATGNADGLGIYVKDYYAYLSRAANSNSDEVVVVNVASPAAPTRSTGLATNLAMNEIYVNEDNVIFAATSSGTQELIKYTPTQVGVSYSRTNINLTGTTAATTVTGKSGTVYVTHGSVLTAVNDSSNAIRDNITLTGIINDIAVDDNDDYLFAGTTAATGEFQVTDISSPGNLVLAGSADVTGTTNSLNGVAYNAKYDIVAVARAANAEEAAVFIKN